MIESLYQYNDWANRRIFDLAENLTDEQLDSPLELGLGSLRATMQHIWAAEQIWLERWQNVPAPVFHSDPQGASLSEIAKKLATTASDRQVLLDAEASGEWGKTVSYRNLQQNEYSNVLIDMLMHVANHGIHHRAQALHYLKQFDRKAVGGIDYLFYRIAHPSTPLIAEFIGPMRQFGMEADTSPGAQVVFRLDLIQDFFRYHDWANQQLIPLAKQLDSAALHESRAMGVGSIHQTLSHLRDAERWWLGIWYGSIERFPKYNPQEELSELEQSWQQVSEQRNSVVASLDAESAARVVVASPANMRVPFRVIESMVQLCCHGTHHRAQVVNMLRKSGAKPPAIDYIVWLRCR